MSNNYQNNKDFSKLPRAEKLYILSQACIQNMLTPDDTAFMGEIIRFCTSRFAMSKDTAKEYADDLISAYRADQWEGLAAAHQPDDIDTPQDLTQTPRVFTPTKSILDNYKIATCEPVKRVERKLAYEGETAPATLAKTLYGMAQADQFNGVGRISIHEARNALDNRQLRAEDITALIKQYYPRADTEQRAGNIVLVYFAGKTVIKDKRYVQRIVQPPAPSMKPINLTLPEPRYERDAEYGDKENYSCGEAPEMLDTTDEIPEVE